MRVVEWVCLGGRGCGIQRIAECRCTMMDGYYPRACLVVGAGKWVEAKAAATSHNKRKPRVDIPAYSYYGDLSKRRYDLPERESGDWQGRP